MNNDKHFFTALEALRGIAAIMVIFRHTEGALGPISPTTSYLAVDLFFLLSGVVLANSYRLRLKMGQISPAGFMLQRVIRLYPLYLVSLPIGFTSYAIQNGWDGFKLAELSLKAALFIPSTGMENLFPFNGPSWSLFFELWVGMLFAILLIRMSLLSLAALAIGAAFVTLSGARIEGSFDIGFQPNYFLYGFSRVVFSFSIGVCLHRLSTDRKLKIPDNGNVIGLLLCGCLLVITSLPASMFFGYPWFDLLTCLVTFPAIVLLSMHTQQTGLTEALFRWLGRLSYPVYILHGPIFSLLHSLRQRGFDLPSSRASGMVAVVGILTAAALLAVFFDEPVRRKLKSVLAPNSPVRPVTSGVEAN